MSTIIPSVADTQPNDIITKGIKTLHMHTSNFDADEKDSCVFDKNQSMNKTDILYAEDSKEAEYVTAIKHKEVECEDIEAVDYADYYDDDIVEEVEEEQEFDGELFDREMEKALENVRNLAKVHQQAFVNEISDTFAFMTGHQPSINDISAIFGRIRNEFANEANDDNEDYEDYDEYASDEDESDSDYDANNYDDQQQVINDFDSDYFVEEEEEENKDSDSDYDENNEEDVKQHEEDENEDCSESESYEESDDESVECDEEKIINAQNFDTEYFEAIDVAIKAAKIDREKMLETIKEKYECEIGEKATDQQIADALKEFVESDNDENQVEDEDDDNEEDEIEEDVQVE